MKHLWLIITETVLLSALGVLHRDYLRRAGARAAGALKNLVFSTVTILTVCRAGFQVIYEILGVAFFFWLGPEEMVAIKNSFLLKAGLLGGVVVYVALGNMIMGGHLWPALPFVWQTLRLTYVLGSRGVDGNTEDR
jgi:hypothetical protein